jgi:hypothetical protein
VLWLYCINLLPNLLSVMKFTKNIKSRIGVING